MHDGEVIESSPCPVFEEARIAAVAIEARANETMELVRSVADAAVQDGATVDTASRELGAGIAGVELVRLTIHADARGALSPVLDTRMPFWDEPIVYAYGITILPGRIKGWGMHRIQTDRYYMARGSVRVVLFDGREDSPSVGQFAQINFTVATPGLLRIPPGVWHADQNWGEDEALIVNFPTRAYDPAAPDKYRIDPHAGVIPFDWSTKDG